MVYTDFKVTFTENLIDLEEKLLAISATKHGITELSIAPTKRILMCQGDDVRAVIKFLAEGCDVASVGMIQEIINYEVEAIEEVGA